MLILLTAGFVGRWDHLQVAVIKKRQGTPKKAPIGEMGTWRAWLDSFNLCMLLLYCLVLEAVLL